MQDNVWAYWLLKQFKAVAPDQFHDCPYSVSDSQETFDYLTEFNFQSLKVQNFHVRADLLPHIFPRGDYKSLGFITDRNKKLIVNVTQFVTIKSSEIETFG